MASKKVGGEFGDEGIRWVFLYFYLSRETEMRKRHKSSILLKDKDFLHTRLQQLLHTGTDVKQKKRHICKVMCSAHDEY